MPTDTALTAPHSWTQVEASSGLAHTAFIAGNVLEKFAEKFDPMRLGILVMLGDLAGTGADTMRVPETTPVGLAVPLQALGSETAQVPISTRTIGYTDFSTGRYGLGWQDTYEAALFNLPQIWQTLNVDQIVQQAPGHFAATIRGLASTAGAAIAQSVGSASVKTSLDTCLALAAYFNTAGNYMDGMPRPVGMAHPYQIEHIKESARVEPGFQNSGDFERIQGIETNQVIENFLGLGFDLARSDGVTTSGGAYQGFVGDRGFIGVVTADTGRIVSEVRQPGAEFLALPGLGMLIVKHAVGADQARRQQDIRAWIGCSLGSTEVFRMSKMIGQTA